jgi:hypothetical protein
LIDTPLNPFKATIDIIGVNPFVFVPSSILESIFKDAQKSKGPIPVSGTIDGHPFIQTLVKFKGDWRLYINGPMLKVSKKQVGDAIALSLQYDPKDRTIEMHPKLKKALEENEKASIIFQSLRPSLQKEIIRYISFLKTEHSVDKNVDRAIKFILGNECFIGRDKPE